RRQRVAVAGRLDYPVEDPAQARDVRADDPGRAARRLAAPQRPDQVGRGHLAALVEQQDGQRRALLRRAEFQDVVAARRPDRPQQLEPQPARHCPSFCFLATLSARTTRVSTPICSSTDSGGWWSTLSPLATARPRMIWMTTVRNSG